MALFVDEWWPFFQFCGKVSQVDHILSFTQEKASLMNQFLSRNLIHRGLLDEDQKSGVKNVSKILHQMMA